MRTVGALKKTNKKTHTQKLNLHTVPCRIFFQIFVFRYKRSLRLDVECDICIFRSWTNWAKTAVRSGHGILITDSGPPRSGAPSLEPLLTGSLRIPPTPAPDHVSRALPLDVWVIIKSHVWQLRAIDVKGEEHSFRETKAYFIAHDLSVKLRNEFK